MSFRDKWGLPEKYRHTCPICGVESRAEGKPCKTHKNAQNVAMHRARRLKALLTSAIDEARS